MPKSKIFSALGSIDTVDDREGEVLRRIGESEQKCSNGYKDIPCVISSWQSPNTLLELSVLYNNLVGIHQAKYSRNNNHTESRPS